MRSLRRRLFVLLLAALALAGCAGGGGIAPRGGKPPVPAGDAGPRFRDAARPDAGAPPREVDAGPAAVALDGGPPLPSPIDAGPAPLPELGCRELGSEGACLGTVARWCEGGVIDEYDCARGGLDCAWVEEERAYGCVASPPPPPDDGCGGVDYLGDCQGQLVRWCDGEALNYRDCALDGLRCGWVDEETGFWCVP